MRLAILAFLAPSLAAATPGGTDLTVRFENLRSGKGSLRVCLTQHARYFPDCTDDPGARKMLVPASSGVATFRDIAPGQYALSAFHDENGNGKLDKMAIMPREGFGFSRNPAIRFGPPKYDEARFSVSAGSSEQKVRLRYML